MDLETTIISFQSSSYFGGILVALEAGACPLEVSSTILSPKTALSHPEKKLLRHLGVIFYSYGESEHI